MVCCYRLDRVRVSPRSVTAGRGGPPCLPGRVRLASAPGTCLSGRPCRSLNAVACGTLALSRGERINAVWLLFAALWSYAIGYRFYARFIAYRSLAWARTGPRLRSDWITASTFTGPIAGSGTGTTSRRSLEDRGTCRPLSDRRGKGRDDPIKIERRLSRHLGGAPTDDDVDGLPGRRPDFVLVA